MVNAFVISIFVICAIVLYFSASMLKKNRAILILTPAALSACLSLGWSVKSIQSMPIHERPTEEMAYRHHYTDGQTITLWAQTGSYPQTWIFPYTDEDSKALEESKGRTESGGTVYVDPKQEGGFSVSGQRFDSPSNKILKPYEH